MSLISTTERSLIRVLCSLGISFSTVQRAEFLEFVRLIGGDPESILPFHRLRQQTIRCATETKEENLEKPRGKCISVIVDGTTIGDRTF